MSLTPSPQNYREPPAMDVAQDVEAMMGPLAIDCPAATVDWQFERN